MVTRFEKARVCVFLMFACSYCGVALAASPAENNVLEDQLQKSDGSSSTLVIDYSSVFDNYIPFDQMPDIGWKEANDNVGRIGGWRAYAKLVQEEAKKQMEAEKEAEQQSPQVGDDQ